MNPYADPEISPLAVARRLDDETGREWRAWDPDTLWDHCKLDEGQVQQRDKIMATQVACTNQDAFEDPFLFSHVVVAMNGRRASFEYLDKPSPSEAAWACLCLRSLAPYSFGPGVLRFLVALCLDDGVAYFPWTSGDNGQGLDVLGSPYSQGLADPQPELVARLRSAVAEHGALDVEIGEVDDSDPLQAQLAKLAAIQQYVKAAEAEKGDTT